MKVLLVAGFTCAVEYVQVVKWIRALSLTILAPVRIPVVCQNMIGVAYIQLTINNCVTGIGLAYFFAYFLRFKFQCLDK